MSVTLLVAIPLSVAFYILYRFRMARGCPRQRALIRTVAEFVILLNAVTYLLMTLWPSGNTYAPDRTLVLFPSTVGLVSQLGGNLLLLTPIAAAGRFRISWMGTYWGTALTGFFIATGDESLQYFLGIGRVTSIVDVLLQTLGCLIAHAVVSFAARLSRRVSFLVAGAAG